MTNSIILDGQTIEYSIRLSKRSKSKQISMSESGEITVVLPASRRYTHPEKYATQILQEYKKWIFQKMKERPSRPWTGKREEYLKYKEVARDQIIARLRFYNAQYKFTYHRVSVRNQTSRWGSCSDKGNLSFNYRMIFLQEHLFDYVIVHELCHLQELNHSQKFWQLMSQSIAEPRSLAKELAST